MAPKWPLAAGIAMHAAFAALFGPERRGDVTYAVVVLHDTYCVELQKAGVRTALHYVNGQLVTIMVEGDDPQLTHTIKEQHFLLEVMLRAWHHLRYPAIMEEYEPMLVEQEWVWPLGPGVEQEMRMDVILRRRDDGALVILDFKNIGVAHFGWAEKFEHDDQTLSYVQAAIEHFAPKGYMMGGIMYEGLVKGQWRKETAKSSPFNGLKITSSPYAYGYKLSGPDGTIYQTKYTAAKGWRKVAAWEELSAKEWFEQVILPEHRAYGLLTELFLMVPPIDPVPAEMESWRRQQLYGEVEVASKLEELEKASDDQRHILLDIYFPQHRWRCDMYGVDNGCAFKEICNNSQVAADPLADGKYVARVSHHAGEGEVEQAA